MIGAFLLSAFIVPLATPALVGDDWVYVRTVQILLREGRLEVLDLSVVTLLFQAAWGALFATVFGLSFGVLRLSTVVMAALGGIATYGVCRELGVGRGWSALGAAAYLFNPLAYVLGFTFMTDPHFAAMLMVAGWGYLRALRPGAESARLLWVASGLAALAFLVRQQGALIPPAVLLALVLSRRLRFDGDGLKIALRVALAPGLTILLYALWLTRVHGVPEQQGSFVARIAEAGWAGGAVVAGEMAFVEAIYLGLFVLPVVLAGIGRLGASVRTITPVGWAIAAAWVALLGVGLVHFDAFGFEPPPMPRMPYVPQYVALHGLGPTDLLGDRPWLVGWRALDALTLLAAASSIVYALLLVAKLAPVPMRRDGRPDATRFAAGVLLAIAGGQALGIVPPSFHFRGWIVSVDRYLLPLLPLALCLGIWALQGRPAPATWPSWLSARLPAGRAARLPARLPAWPAWLATAVLAVFSIAGTRDLLVFQAAVWSVGQAALGMGVPLTRLDAGAAWDGYHLYEYSVDNGIPTQSPGGPWWTDLFAPATDSAYVVASAFVPGYDPIGQTTYSSWLHGGDLPLYLLRRQGVPGPP